MLELAKILRDIDNLGRERAGSIAGIPDEVRLAGEVMSRVGEDLDGARKKIREAKTSWLTTSFDESPGKVYELPPLPAQHVVVATDGSQITPDKHEVTLCYLLNASSIIIYYGNGERPVATTSPKLCYKDEDLFENPYGGRRVRVNEKILGMRRTLAESARMLEAIRAAKASGIPAVALWDGSLIRWSLESEPPDYRDRVLNEYLSVFDAAKEMGIPIAGYISDPGSTDVVNSLRIMLCDRDRVDCDFCAYRERNEAAPCDAIAHLRDVSVLKNLLKGAKRSVIFSSTSSILERYGEHKVKAFYMDAGREVVRVEIPEWVANDPGLLDQTHAVCRDQAEKGRGYPVALSQAHEHAVVRGPEARAFYEMVERSFIKHGAPVTYSLKRVSKGY